ncbi:PH domain-containing protein [Candidatus Saccharibacteria bacterium]|nr:PH domain-containing protein [Candidatus Saccharibacteria bacterium]
MKSDLAKLRHARSKKDFPDISLEENEYVVLKIKRSGIIPVLVWSGVILSAIFFIALNIIIANASTGMFSMNSASKGFFSIVLDVVFGVVLIAALVSSNVYASNKLFVTNKRIIQKTQASLFSSATNVIDLISIEDVSFKQTGLFEHILKIGTLRMSTVGDETTYTFKCVDTPIDELEVITHLVHVEKQENEVNIKSR